jgi:hypothetical protein
MGMGLSAFSAQEEPQFEQLVSLLDSAALPKSEKVSAKAYSVMLAVALARGSAAQLLFIVEAMLTGSHTSATAEDASDREAHDSPSPSPSPSSSPSSSSLYDVAAFLTSMTMYRPKYTPPAKAAPLVALKTCFGNYVSVNYQGTRVCVCAHACT